MASAALLTPLDELADDRGASQLRVKDASVLVLGRSSLTKCANSWSCETLNPLIMLLESKFPAVADAKRH